MKPWQRRRQVGHSAAALVIFFAMAGVAAAAVSDPVEDLRQALPVDDVQSPTEAMLTFRKDNLQKRIDALQTIGQLRRALALDDWRDDPSRVVDERIRRIDADLRKQVGERLKARLEKEAQSPDPTTRLAVANLIAEMGPTVRALTPDDRTGYARSLTTKPVLELVADRDLGVRQEALRALGTIFAKPNEAAGTFAQILNSDPNVGPRRLAAEGLGQMIRVVTHLQKRGRTAAGVEATRPEGTATLLEVIRAVPAGADDADPYVRFLCLDALQTAAQGLSDLIPDALARKELPPAGRPWTEIEQSIIDKLYNDVRAEVAEVAPVMAALDANHTVLSAALRDPDARVRLAAAQTLMHSAWSGQRLRLRAYSLPAGKGRDPAQLLAGADPLAQFLQKDLAAVPPLFRESDARIRKAAGYALLLLEERAFPLAGVIQANLADSDRAVRWASAKAFGYLPADKIGAAVPGLAKLLSDPDPQMKIIAAATLKGMGPLARDAISALAEATTHGDTDGRNAAMDAILALGTDVAKEAVPQLTVVLQQTDAEPKAIANAAQTLGEIGPAAASAVPVLRRLIGHDDADVRAAASEAILSINGRRE